jgi:Matrixin
MSTARLPILVAVLLAFAAPHSHAFTREIYNAVAVEWNKDRTVLVHLSLPNTCGGSPCGPFADGLATYNDVAEEAFNIWNQELVHLHVAVNKNSIVPPSDIDANTSVTMSNTIYGDTFGSNVLAVTLVTPRTKQLIEADVIFNSAYQWDSYRGSLDVANKGYDLRRVALHEFGHVLGLDHPDEANPAQHVIAIMNSTVSHIDTLQADDISGIHSIYDTGPDYQNANSAPNLVNLSTRAFVGTGNNVVIGGFIVQGSDPATVILRGIGYSLPALGISNALEDPVIELRSGGTLIATSDDWIDDSWGSTVASYHLDPSNSRESVLIQTLNPGSYTVVLRAFENGDTGVGLIELYDLHTTNGRAGNISTRGPVLSGNQVLIGGFIVGGSQNKDIIVRALGPSLSGLGVSGALSDPTVELRNSSGALITSNDNWQTDPNSAFIQSKNLAPTNPAESALAATLSPGSYTAIVRGANNATGVGLVEVYDLSPSP